MIIWSDEHFVNLIDTKITIINTVKSSYKKADVILTFEIRLASAFFYYIPDGASRGGPID